ncbi:MAG: energy transducer TonB, partial [Azonexus sp.]|nr:energy transducer TonB [Azonexus sp.]
PSYEAAYLNNPKPSYPALSRRLGEEGAVKLRVLVTADGRAATVELVQSSNFPRLDEAARQAVAHWRFVPARRGGEAVEATVIVPVVFRLDN